VSRRLLSALLTVFVVFLSLGVQEAADAKAPAQRLVIAQTGTNAHIVPVPVRNGRLMIGHSVSDVYTPKGGDPFCDPLGTSVIAGHTYRAGDGVADNWRTLKSGARIRVPGCTFKVTKVKVVSGKFRIGRLMRPDGPPRLILIGCKPDDYSRRILVFAKMVG